MTLGVSRLSAVLLLALGGCAEGAFLPLGGSGSGDAAAKRPSLATAAPSATAQAGASAPAAAAVAVPDGAALVAALDGAAIPFTREPFPEDNGPGENVVVSYGSGASELVIGARFTSADGAGTRGCGVALVKAYELLTRERPPRNVTVRLVFFGGPSGEADGAATYADAVAPDAVLGMLNLSVCGPGRAFGVWDVRGAAERSLIVDALLQAGDSEGLSVGFRDAPEGPRDHAGFQARGIPAVGISVLPAGGGDDGASIDLAAQLVASTVGVFDAFLGAER